MTRGILRSSLNKEKMYIKVMDKPKDNQQHIAYIKYRNLFFKLKRITKSNYYSKQIEDNKNDMKNTWNIMKAAMNKLNDKTNVPQIINYQNETLTEENQISNAFCKFFSEVRKTYANKYQNQIKNLKTT